MVMLPQNHNSVNFSPVAGRLKTSGLPSGSLFLAPIRSLLRSFCLGRSPQALIFIFSPAFMRLGRFVVSTALFRKRQSFCGASRSLANVKESSCPPFSCVLPPQDFLRHLRRVACGGIDLPRIQVLIQGKVCKASLHSVFLPNPPLHIPAQSPNQGFFLADQGDTMYRISLCIQCR